MQLIGHLVIPPMSDFPEINYLRFLNIFYKIQAGFIPTMSLSLDERYKTSMLSFHGIELAQEALSQDGIDVSHTVCSLSEVFR